MGRGRTAAAQPSHEHAAWVGPSPDFEFGRQRSTVDACRPTGGVFRRSSAAWCKGGCGALQSSRPASGRSPPRPPALAGTVTIAPEADTFVVGEEGLTTTNYGGFDFLDTYGGFTRNCEPWAAPAYGLLRFPLGAIPAGRQLMDARVRLVERASYAQDGDPNHHIVFIANDTWLESGVGGVTWATKPSDGTVAPGDPTLARVPGRRHPSLDVRARLELHPPRRARLQRRPDPARQHGARLPHTPDPNALKNPDQSERDLLTRLAGERGGDGKLSVEVYNPNCPVCPAGTNRAYWVRYWSKEAADPAVRPRRTVRYADISLQASAPSPVAAGRPVRYMLTYKNDTAGPLTVTVRRAPCFPRNLGRRRIGERDHLRCTARGGRDPGLGRQRLASGGCKACGAVHAHRLGDARVVRPRRHRLERRTGRRPGRRSPWRSCPGRTASPPRSNAATARRPSSRQEPIRSAFSGCPLDAIIHPASTPITQQPITQQPITQQPITQQPITQQPITQQPIAQMPITEFGFADAGNGDAPRGRDVRHAAQH